MSGRFDYAWKTATGINPSVGGGHDFGAYYQFDTKLRQNNRWNSGAAIEEAN